jgi:hypothetical protein
VRLEKQRQRAEKRYARNKEIVRLAKDRPCVDCRVQYPSAAMDLDHIRGVKVGNVATMRSSATVENLLTEIAKCDVRCANCHRLRHALESE